MLENILYSNCRLNFLHFVAICPPLFWWRFYIQLQQTHKTNISVGNCRESVPSWSLFGCAQTMLLEKDPEWFGSADGIARACCHAFSQLPDCSSEGSLVKVAHRHLCWPSTRMWTLCWDRATCIFMGHFLLNQNHKPEDITQTKSSLCGYQQQSLLLTPTII